MSRCATAILLFYLLVTLQVNTVLSIRDGDCPPVVPPGGNCFEQCTADEVCPGSQKCCSTGCGHQCQEPINVFFRNIASTAITEANKSIADIWNQFGRLFNNGSITTTTTSAPQLTSTVNLFQGFPFAAGQFNPQTTTTTAAPFINVQSNPNQIGFQLNTGSNWPNNAINQLNQSLPDSFKIPPFNAPSTTTPRTSTTTTTAQTTRGPDAGKCFVIPDIGLCKAILRRWYYDQESNVCREFNYGGCGGNENNFKTQKLCEDACKMPEKSPFTELQSGIERWAFGETTTAKLAPANAIPTIATPGFFRQQQKDNFDGRLNSQEWNFTAVGGQSRQQPSGLATTNIDSNTAGQASLGDIFQSNRSSTGRSSGGGSFVISGATFPTASSDSTGDDQSGGFPNFGSSFCFSTQFKCRSGGCIEKSKTCDGTKDCKNGEDEDPGYCNPETVPQTRISSQSNQSWLLQGGSSNSAGGTSPTIIGAASTGPSSFNTQYGACKSTNCPACYKCEMNIDDQPKCIPDMLQCCPDGSRPKVCFFSPCQNARCGAFPNARCIADYCGADCKPRYYDEQLNEIAQERCSSPPTTGGTTPTDSRFGGGLFGPFGGSTTSQQSPNNGTNAVVWQQVQPTGSGVKCGQQYCRQCEKCEKTQSGDSKCLPDSTSCCPDGSRPNPCYVNPCFFAKCSVYPNAKCIADGCVPQFCAARFFDESLNELSKDACDGRSSGITNPRFQPITTPGSLAGQPANIFPWANLQPTTRSPPIWVGQQNRFQNTGGGSGFQERQLGNAAGGGTSQQQEQDEDASAPIQGPGPFGTSQNQLSDRTTTDFPAPTNRFGGPTSDDPLKGVPSNWRGVYARGQHGVTDLKNPEDNLPPGRPIGPTTTPSLFADWRGSQKELLQQQPVETPLFTTRGVSSSDIAGSSKLQKSGVCPVIQRISGIPSCILSCQNDEDCSGETKCCMSSCGKTCLPPA